MGKTTGIEWAEATWNPFMGCAKVSAGCKNCYMFRDQKRFGHDPTVLRRSKTTFYDPLKWEEPRVIFVCSWSDFFWGEVPQHWRDDAWGVIDECQQHTFLLLTKRPENIKSMLPDDWWPNIHERSYRNVWLGVSVESQEHVGRIGELYNIPARVKFVSAEPLLGPLDLSEHMGFIDWVIAGGESDLSNPRPAKLDWFRTLRHECDKHGVPFFLKQLGGTRKIDGAWGGRELDGRTWDEIPSRDLRES